MLTRRDALRIGAASFLPIASRALAAPPEDHLPRSGRLFVVAQLRTGVAAQPIVGGLEEIDMKEGTWNRVVPESRESGLIELRVSPDARRFASVRRVAGEPESSVWVGRLDGNEPPRKVAAGFSGPCWSPDGRALIASRRNLRDPEGPRVENVRMEPDGTGRSALPMARADEVEDWSPDGRWLIAQGHHRAPDERTDGAIDLVAVRPDGTDRRVLVEGGRNFRARTSPDGRRVAYIHFDGRQSLWVADLDGKVRKRLVEDDGTEGFVTDSCWSPDGKALAVVFLARQDDNLDYRIELFDVEDGSRHPVPLPRAVHIDSPNWR